MAISERVRRLLLSRSGGYCMNPTCNFDLFVHFNSGAVSSVEELAHVIAERNAGPRGDSSLPANQRDEYDNIIVLCPTCHRLVDKNVGQFPVELLRQWKQEHEETIERCFRVPRFASRIELAREVRDILRKNRIIFETYGPFSAAMNEPLTDAAVAWQRAVRSDVIPNNRLIYEVMYANRELLSASDLQTLERFKLHRDAFEYNHLSGDKIANAPVFPREMERLFENCDA